LASPPHPPGFFAGDRNANVWAVTFAHKF
jgi:hypothetical protein